MTFQKYYHIAIFLLKSSVHGFFPMAMDNPIKQFVKIFIQRIPKLIRIFHIKYVCGNIYQCSVDRKKEKKRKIENKIKNTSDWWNYLFGTILHQVSTFLLMIVSIVIVVEVFIYCVRVS